MMGDFKDRLREFVAYKGLSPNKFMTAVGMPLSFFNNTKELTSRRIHEIIERFPELSIEWLMTGRGKMLYEAESTQKETDPIGSDILSYLKDKDRIIQEKDEYIAQLHHQVLEQSHELMQLTRQNIHLIEVIRRSDDTELKKEIAV